MDNTYENFDEYKEQLMSKYGEEEAAEMAYAMCEQEHRFDEEGES